MSNLSIGDRAMRKFALLILDEEDGIKEEAYQTLSIMLAETNNEDILENVDIAQGRAYVGEDFAAEELTRLNDGEA